MNFNTWENMTIQQRSDFLNNGKLVIDKRNGLNPHAKVNQVENSVISQFRGEVEGVVITHWCNSQDEAMEQSAETLKRWREAAAEDCNQTEE